MEQRKTGQFIAELRKEQELTQQKLAEKIGVSNKTVSKWECGNGMPDISSIIPLCEVLNITVNELIAGERLTRENYPQKADENMMHFMKKEEKQKKKSMIFSRFIITVSVLFFSWFTIFSCFGNSMWSRFFDAGFLVSMIMITFSFLLCTKLIGSFLYAFMMLLNRTEFSEEQCFLSYQAVKMARTVWLCTGILITGVCLSAMIPIGDEIELMLEYLRYTYPLAITGFLYGIIGYLLLLPIQMKLEFVQHGF